MEFGGRHVVNEWLDETCRFTLADEGRGCGYDSFGTRDVHRLEKEPSAIIIKSLSLCQIKKKRLKNLQVLDDPLHHSKLESNQYIIRMTPGTKLVAHIVHHLHEGNEKDDGRELIRQDQQVNTSSREVNIKTYSIDEEVALSDDSVGEEERCSGLGLLQEIGCQQGDPFED